MASYADTSTALSARVFSNSETSAGSVRKPLLTRSPFSQESAEAGSLSASNVTLPPLGLATSISWLRSEKCQNGCVNSASQKPSDELLTTKRIFIFFLQVETGQSVKAIHTE